MAGAPARDHGRVHPRVGSDLRPTGRARWRMRPPRSRAQGGPVIETTCLTERSGASTTVPAPADRWARMAVTTAVRVELPAAAGPVRPSRRELA